MTSQPPTPPATQPPRTNWSQATNVELVTHSENELEVAGTKFHKCKQWKEAKKAAEEERL